jgi:hypothetical protein
MPLALPRLRPVHACMRFRCSCCGTQAATPYRALRTQRPPRPLLAHSFPPLLASACLRLVPSCSALAISLGCLPTLCLPPYISLIIPLPKHWTTCMPPLPSLIFQLSSLRHAAVATRHCSASWRRGACMRITGRAVTDDTSPTVPENAALAPQVVKQFYI